ncbi:hypothetical protein GIB67_023335 [Kingdonia uniflora]|uniref:C2H2-type domain-containing protein n=1 Tax=Kingdonia uniflora TaxID=39325 RepID=A0A7J7LIG7_9MAGN|nr:hypothetical protein GIB67_023335 [Kingdonia uniflora]
MPMLSCNSCNSDFEDEIHQKLHYKSEWHRYNLKRKVAGVPGVTEALFQARQSALAQEQNKLNAAPMLYSCELCGKGYRSSKAHAQHLKSRTHIMRATPGTHGPKVGGDTVITPLPTRIANNPALPRMPERPISKKGKTVSEDDSDDDDWVSVHSNDTIDTNPDNDMDPDAELDSDAELDPSCCFICDLEHSTIENCMIHMHKHHGFFIPDIEYLKDPKGLLTYLGLKVRRDFMCLYCNDRCLPFNSLEAVRKHMVAKRHCKVRYGDGGDDEEPELDEFYDYSSSYVGADGEKLVASDDLTNEVELGTGGSELLITKKTDSGTSIRSLGSREYLRYYKQKPRPSIVRDVALAAALASRYKSMGLATVQSKENMVRLKVLKEMNRSGVEMMRSKMGMKSNVIRNLPKNCTY